MAGAFRWALPGIEVFNIPGDYQPEPEALGGEGEPLDEGWYYWHCSVGYLPESNLYGPYKSERDAVRAARREGRVGRDVR